MLAQTTPYDAATSSRLERWDSIRRIGKPIVAAVSGFCLGGGCELAMLCDLIVASETAQFGQPEINLGLMPGAGGTQRLTRAVGKAVAMDVILSGRVLSAREAQAAGLVARVVEREAWLDESKRLARDDRREEPARARAWRSRPSTERSRARFSSASSTSGRRSRSHSATEDAHEGMSAFIEKRRPSSKESEMKVDELLSGVREAMSVKKVFGESIHEDGITVIPVAKVGGGGGGGGDTEGNGGGGFGLAAKPAGAYVIKDGEVSGSRQ